MAKRNNKMNPFLVRGFVKDEWFCDREQETKQLLANIQNGRDTTLISPRKYGKTGLIFHLFHQIEQQKLPYDTLYIDLFHTRDLQDFIKALGDTLVRYPEQTSFSERIMKFLRQLRPTFSFDQLTGEPQISFNYQQESDKATTLQHILEFLNNQPQQIVIALDEFQQVATYPEHMEALLRGTIQNLHNLRFIFSGSRQTLMTEMFLSPKRPFFSQTSTLTIDKIPEDKYAPFIRLLFENDGIKCNDDALNQILYWTQRHTFYTQSLCNYIYSLSPETVDLDIVNHACARLLDLNETAYMQYRELLTNIQWQMLVAVAKEGEIMQINSSTFLHKYGISGTTTARRTIQTLVDKELILALPTKKQTKYQIYDVFFMHWLAREY